MRTISKAKEPKCLAQLRREADRALKESGQAPKGSAWELPKECAELIRLALCAEQGHLCAYCMQRIHPRGYRSDLHSKGGMKIEHWADRSEHPAQMYDWDNLLGVCGGEHRGGRGLIQHCDTSRGNAPLVVHPASKSPPIPEKVFYFSTTSPATVDRPKDQRIWICTDDDDSAGDLTSLNLNADHLAKNRHAAREELRIQLRRSQNVNKLLRTRRKVATTPGAHGLPPFAWLIEDYIRKKMSTKGLV